MSLMDQKRLNHRRLIVPGSDLCMSDFDFLDDAFSRVVDKKEKQGLSSLSETERVLLFVWHASGIIGNGGFRYFIEGDNDAGAVADAYGRIGLVKSSEIIRLALSLFPDDRPPKDDAERVKCIEVHEEALRKLSEAFWEEDKAMECSLAKYVRKHL